MDLDALARRPLAEQCAALDALIERGALDGLAVALAAWFDPAPLGHLLRRLLSLAVVPPGLADALAVAPDAHLGRLLRGLPESDCPPAVRGALVEAVARALDRLPPHRVAAACFLLRWIDRADPGRGRKIRDEAIAAAERAVDAPAGLASHTFIRLPGTGYGPLAVAAEARGTTAAWSARLKACAGEMLDALEQQPKSLSQVGAEELLSRRVYTDPAHFLMELIQNAEDARARVWSLTVTPERLIVEHDGVPFDARDAVGVLSIGQTTKSDAHIGFFGVGFKAVYGVTDRPRVVSGPFDFEIADVSIPRRLDGGASMRGTRLELPFRAPDDPRSGWRAIGESAAALPSSLLLTLRHIRTIEVSVDGITRRIERRGASVGAIELVDGATRRRWWVLSERDGEGQGRTGATAVERSVLVGVPLDDAGRPVPLAPEEPSVFCFLPTRDRPGLRVLIHARFPLPVDRERVDIHAADTARALRRAGALLAERAVEVPDPSALLTLLPLPGEVRPDAWEAVRLGFADALAKRPVLPVPDGSKATLQAARLSPSALADALAGIPLVLEDGAPGRAVSTSDERHRAILRALGVRELAPDDVFRLIDTYAADAPRWLLEAAGELLAVVARTPGSARRARAIAPDADGRWWPASSLSRCPARLRFCFVHRPLVAPRVAADARLDVLWRTLGVERLDDADVPEVLLDPALGPPLCAAEGDRILGWMAEQPQRRLRGLTGLRVVPDESGARRPIVDGAPLPTDDPLGRWAHRWPTARPPLVRADVAAAYGELLMSLGARPLTLGGVLDAPHAALGQMAAGPRDDLHRLLDAQAAELAPRLLDRLARAPLFVDVNGQPRCLRGPAAAIVPGHPDLEDLLPDAPWLADGLRLARHVRAIEPRTVGVAAVVEGLIDPEAPLGAPIESPAWHRLAEWVVHHRPVIDDALRARAAAAPIWASASGRYPLVELRSLPDVPAWAALYGIWNRWPAPTDEAVALARALGLDGAEPAPAETFAADLIAMIADDGWWQDDAVAPALAQLAHRASPVILAPLAASPIHRGAAGEREPLHGHGGSLRPAEAPWRPLLEGAVAVLDAEWQARIDPFPAVVGCAPAGLDEALTAAEAGELQADAWRATLVGLGPWSDEITRRLSALAIWPTDGGLRSASAICLPSRLQGLPSAARHWYDGGHGLEPAALDEAEALADRLSFSDPIAAIEQAVTAQARVGSPLADQVPGLSTIRDVLALREALRAAGRPVERMPLRVDLTERLAVGPMFAATPDAQALVATLPLASRVAHPDDAPLSPDPDAQLPARLLLSALAEVRLDEAATDAHPVLHDVGRRGALYRWLESVTAEIDGDEQARGQLGRAPIWPTVAGLLRRPDGLAPLDEGWPDDEPALGGRRPGGEIPHALLGHLRRWFGLDSRRLRSAVEYLLDVMRTEAGDVAVSARRVGLLARLLESAVDEQTPLEALVARFKLHRRLKIATADGERVRPRELYVPHDPAQGERVATFHAAPPPRPHPAHGPEIAVLLRAAGAAGDLDDRALSDALDRPVPGLDAGLARVAYLARRAAADPALVARLDLGERAWLLDREGQPCAPHELDWPDAELDALIGPDGGCRPHPAVVHAMSPELVERLPFRGVREADPVRVARRLLDGQPASMSVLRWFDAALDARWITPEDARRALSGRSVFGDDDGRCRRPEALVRDLEPPGLGRRRGGFADGRATPRLLGALGIPATVDDGVRLCWLDEIADDVRGGVDVLAREPELRSRIPEAIGALAARAAQRPPIVLARRGSTLELVPIDDPRLTWPWPPELIEAAAKTRLAIAAVETDEPTSEASARRWGLATLAGRWRADPSARPRHGEPDDRMTETLAALWLRMPRVLGIADWGEPPRAVRVEDASQPGTLQGVAAPWPRRAGLDGDRLLLGPDAEAVDVSEAIWRARLCAALGGSAGAVVEDEVCARLARLIACGHGAAMDLLLDAEGLPPEARRPAQRRALPGPESAPAEPSPQTEAAAAPEAVPPPPTRAPEDDAGLLDRLKRWWRGDAPDPDPEPEAPAPPPSSPRPPKPRAARPTPAQRPPPAEDRGFSPPDTTRFFRPQHAVESQLAANPNWLATRQTATEIGFAFAPGRLAGVHQYGPALIADRFDTRGRRWTASAIDPEWSRPAVGAGFRVAFTGRLTTGESGLAVPLFGRVVEIRAEGARQLTARDGRPILVTGRPTEVQYAVELSRAPRYVDEPPPRVAGLLTPTVPDEELPAECHDLVGALLDTAPRARVRGIGEFVRRHYRYDPRYLEDPEHARWLRRATRGRANVHVAALHAGRDGRHLGAGVCYELNALVCELARRAGIPAGIATGWTFDRGWIDQPDHLWAMCLLASEDGPRWLPVDASSTRTGRPLHASPRPPGPHRAQAPRQSQPAPAPVAWTDVAVPETDESAPLRELLRVMRHAENVGRVPERDDAERLRLARQALVDPQRARAMLAAIGGDVADRARAADIEANNRD